MRLLIWLGLTLPAFAQIAFVDGGLATTSGGVASKTLTCPGANFIAIVVAEYGMGASAVSGTMSSTPANTWQNKGNNPDGGNSNVAIWYAENVTVGGGGTITIEYDSTFPAMVPMCFSGVKTSSASDQYVAGHGIAESGGNPVPYYIPGGITPTTSGQLIITGSSSDEASAPLGDYTAYPTDKYVVTGWKYLTGGVSTAVGGAYYIQPTAANIAVGWTGFFSGPTLAGSFFAGDAPGSAGGTASGGKVTLGGKVVQ